MILYINSITFIIIFIFANIIGFPVLFFFCILLLKRHTVLHLYVSNSHVIIITIYYRSHIINRKQILVFTCSTVISFDPLLSLKNTTQQQAYHHIIPKQLGCRFIIVIFVYFDRKIDLYSNRMFCLFHLQCLFLLSRIPLFHMYVQCFELFLLTYNSANQHSVPQFTH